MVHFPTVAAVDGVVVETTITSACGLEEGGNLEAKHQKDRDVDESLQRGENRKGLEVIREDTKDLRVDSADVSGRMFEELSCVDHTFGWLVRFLVGLWLFITG